MRNHRLLINAVLTSILLLVGSVFASCSNFSFTDDAMISSRESEYRFNPLTIQKNITSGSDNIFNLVWEYDGLGRERPTSDPVTKSFPPISWKEQDFLRIIQALPNGDSIRSAQLNEIYFTLLCKEAEIGPQQMALRFFKKSTYYLRQTVRIDARAGSLNWEQTTFSEVRSEDRPVDDHISAEIALQKAEILGGKNLRIALKNDCGISAYIFDDKWRIKYESITGKSQIFLGMEIDKKTGEGKIFWTPSPTP